MLNVQKYLFEKSIKDLQDEFAIQVVRHPVDPLLILNYHQIDSPKYHPIVRECRGLILEEKTFLLAGRSFNRFFNYGEGDDHKVFNWNNFAAYEKRDGSCLIVFWYGGSWRINTRGSFGDGVLIENPKTTWRELVLPLLSHLQSFDKNCSYVFELTSPHNTVVRQHVTTEISLLTVFNYEWELPQIYVDKIAKKFSLNRPKKYSFSSLEEIQSALADLETSDPTFEGFVLLDDQFNRLKMKSKSYLAYHRLKGNGSLFLPKNLIPLLLRGEASEVNAIFPESAEIVDECSLRLGKALANLKKLQAVVKSVDDQKSFALAIKDEPLKAILFKARSTGASLESVWRSSDDLIVKAYVGELI